MRSTYLTNYWYLPCSPVGLSSSQPWETCIPTDGCAARRRAGEQGSAFAFGVRLIATVVLTFTLTGVDERPLLERNLARLQINQYAHSQRADAKAFELESTRATGSTDGIGDIDRLIEGIAQRPDTKEVLLIDSRHVIRATGSGA